MPLEIASIPCFCFHPLSLEYPQLRVTFLFLYRKVEIITEFVPGIQAKYIQLITFLLESRCNNSKCKALILKVTIVFGELQESMLILAALIRRESITFLNTLLST